MNKKVLIVETNINHYPNTNQATGLWLGKSAEFVDEMQKAGIAIDYVSPNGGFIPIDPRSMKYTDADIIKIYNDPDFINRGLRNTLKATDINPCEYLAIYFTGGHGVMWDFPNNSELQKIALAIYDNNGYILSVCHGIAGILNIKDASGNYLIQNKQITGFTKTEELLAGKSNIVPFFNRSVAKQHGAKFSQKRFYKDFAVSDKRIITGQNPFSVRSVAQLFLKELNNANNFR